MINLTIKKKILLLSITFLCLIIGCSIAGIWGLYQVRIAKNQSAAAYNLHDKFQGIRILFEQSLMGPHDYIIHGNKLEKEIFSEDYKNLISKINALKNLIISNK